METVVRARSAEGIEVVALLLDVPDDDAVRPLFACLSAAERQRAVRLRRPRHARRFITARAGLRRLLAERLQVAPQSIEFTYGEHGKPALGGRLAHAGLSFNLSHCERVAVYAFARGCEVGVDVEAVRAFPEADRIAACFFSRRENEVYCSLAPRDRPVAFFHCWTRKEAFVKALGAGLSLPLHGFDVSLAPGQPPAVESVAGVPGDGGWRLSAFSPLPGFIAATAARGA